MEAGILDEGGREESFGDGERKFLLQWPYFFLFFSIVGEQARGKY